MNKTKTIIITGANGFIGKTLAGYFSAKKWNVKCFQRKPEQNFENTTYHQYELPDIIDEKAFFDCNYVIHCAVQHYGIHCKNSDEINISGTKKLIELCRKNNCKIIFLSTLSAHEKAESHYGKNKLFLESLFNESTDLILKLGLVLGLNGGLFSKIVNEIKKSKTIPLVGSEKPMQTIAVDDLCKIVESGMENNISGIFKIAEPEPFAIKNLYYEISRKLNQKRIFIPLPLNAIYAACLLAEKMNIALPVSSENVLGLKNLKKFETENDLKKFNVSIKNYRQTIDAIL